MLSLLYLFVYLTAGVMIARCLLPRVRVVARVWIGLTLGILLMMWLPALFAFALDFSMAAHWAALSALALMTGGAYLARDRRDAARWNVS